MAPPRVPAGGDMTLIVDQVRDSNGQWRFRVLHRLGKFFSGRYPVYKAAVIRDSRSAYQGMSVEDVFVAVKYVDVNNLIDFSELRRDADRNLMTQEHDNLVNVRKPFVFHGYFCVVSEYMSVPSIRYILASKFTAGMPEEYILVVLREALKGLSHIHQSGFNHKQVHAGNILLNRKPEIKLSFAASVYTPTEEERLPSSLSFLPISTISEWASPPEVFRNPIQYSMKADIWMIGITALEMVFGGLEVADRDNLEKLAKKVSVKRKLPRMKEKNDNKKKYLWVFGRDSNNYPLLERDRFFSKGFEEMVGRCLEWDPKSRPTADQILDMDVFMQLRMTTITFYDLMKNLPVIRDV